MVHDLVSLGKFLASDYYDLLLPLAVKATREVTIRHKSYWIIQRQT